MTMQINYFNTNGTIILWTLILASVVSVSLSVSVRKWRLCRIQRDHQQNTNNQESDVNSSLNRQEHLYTVESGPILERTSMAESSGEHTNQLPNSDIIKQRRTINLDLNAEYVPCSSVKMREDHGNGDKDNGVFALLELKGKGKELVDQDKKHSNRNGYYGLLESLDAVKWGCKGLRGDRSKKLLDSLGSRNESFVISF